MSGCAQTDDDNKGNNPNDDNECDNKRDDNKNNIDVV